MKRLSKILYVLVSTIIYLAISFLLVYMVAHSGNYPSGSDTMYHVYRADSLLTAIRSEGNWYPLINYGWYNSVELMRYWAPLCAYTMALCQYLAGSMLNGYLLYVGIVCFLCSEVWLAIGLKTDRKALSFFIGLIWFFMPNNLYALFGEGNLPRSLSMVFLPLFVYYVYSFLESKKVSRLVGITISFVLILLCHVGYAGMVALGTLLFLLIYALTMKEITECFRVVGAIIFGFLIPGVWLVPSLVTSKQTVDSSETMSNFFQSIFITLNPLYRFQTTTTFYFGLAAFILVVFGMVLGRRKDRPGFWMAFITVILTTTTLYPVVAALPGSSYLWMLRFISIALAFAMLSFVNWKTLKKGFVIGFCCILLLDCIPSYSLFYGTGQGDSDSGQEKLDSDSDEWLIQEGRDITQQRLALLDESTLGSEGAFLVTDWGDGCDATFGAGWEAAETSSNISQLNKAIANGQYLYLFDRCLEMGNDTVIFKTSQLVEDKTEEDLDQAAVAVGYSLIDSNEDYRLYHYDVSGNWGLTTEYSAIGIGSGSANLSRNFPSVKETIDTNIDDYTYEELSQYESIYLDGFTYNDKETAEELVKKLSDSGVEIVISADGIPENRSSRAQEFLGVICNTITFSQGYPLLETIDGEIDADLFPSGHTTWTTVYVDGLDQVWGTVNDTDYEIAFYGTVYNENIKIIGLNLVYYYSLTSDEEVGKLLGRSMDLSNEELPDRTIVNIDVERDSYGMTIESPVDNLNTTYSYHEIYSSDQDLSTDNNLLIVNKGKTVIKYKFPHLVEGIGLSIAATLLWILYCLLLGRKLRQKPEEQLDSRQEDNRIEIGESNV